MLEWVVNFKKPFFLTPNRRTSFLQKLSADTNVRIYYPEAEHLERNFAEPFTLEGSFSDVQRYNTRRCRHLGWLLIYTQFIIALFIYWKRRLQLSRNGKLNNRKFRSRGSIRVSAAIEAYICMTNRSSLSLYPQRENSQSTRRAQKLRSSKGHRSNLMPLCGLCSGTKGMLLMEASLQSIQRRPHHIIHLQAAASLLS